MRRDIVVFGFFIIVLIVIAGCSSPQIGSSTGPKSQTPSQGDSNVKTTSTMYAYPTNCGLPSTNPIRFQKFIPNVEEWNAINGVQNNYYENKEIGADLINPNYIMQQYASLGYKQGITEGKYLWTVMVFFLDFGPCVTESSDVNAFLNNNFDFRKVKAGETTKINFHGYPAVYSTTSGSVRVTIGINNRLAVKIYTLGSSKEDSLSEKEAEIERFANAIDFRGFAASV
jgi:hypothetical protein